MAELTSVLLEDLYNDCRASTLSIAKRHKVPYHTVNKALRDAEKRYDLCYTLELMPERLGFDVNAVIAIKFGKKPPLPLLENELSGNTFVQNAYLCEGDFDLLVHYVCAEGATLTNWEWHFRIALHDYKPEISQCNLSYPVIGFMPLKGELIKRSKSLTDKEKRLLVSLNNNARGRLKDIADETGLSQMQVMYHIKTLKERGSIEGFRILAQDPGKSLRRILFLNWAPTQKHPVLVHRLVSELKNEKRTGPFDDYGVLYDAFGSYDGFCMCDFSDKKTAESRGPGLWRGVYKSEGMRVTSAEPIKLLVGRWPFGAERYGKFIKTVDVWQPSKADYRGIASGIKTREFGELMKGHPA